MPFNQLILPLLGGYILVTYTNCAVYWSTRQPKEQLLFASAFVGALLAIAARVIALTAAKTSCGHMLYEAIHVVVNYEGIGTAVLALLLSLVLRFWINKSWPMPEAGFWLYGKDLLNQFESLLFLSFSGVAPAQQAIFRSLPVELTERLLSTIPLFGTHIKEKRASQYLWRVVGPTDESDRPTPIPLLLTMKDRKVYVGYLEKTPSLINGSLAYINMLVMRSGYRDKDTLHVTFTEDYTAVFDSDGAKHAALPPSKVLPVSDIVSASLFDLEVFELFKKHRLEMT